MALPPPELSDDVVAEIFLRLPPDEPEHLVRASLVCKTWFRLLTDPNFLRLYLTFHRPPPLLGYLEGLSYLEERKFFPTTSAPLAPIPDFVQAHDCHHGRVLLGAYDHAWYLVVWDPVTGDRKRLPEPGIDWVLSSAVVCCAVSDCDHLDCHGGPFRVVIIATDERYQVQANKLCTYSSEKGAWSTPVNLDNDHVPHIRPRRGAVIGDEIYFTIGRPNEIVMYNMRKNCSSMINRAPKDDLNIALMEMEDGSLGFVCIRDSSLNLWSRKVDSQGAAEWVQCKVVELGKKIPFADQASAIVVGAAEGVGVIFVSTGAGLFTIKVDSGQVKKIGEPSENYFSILPFMSFYTPDCKANDSLISEMPLTQKAFPSG